LKPEFGAERPWDLVVWGGGYSGLAASLSGQSAGLKVLWIESSGVLLSETSWGFAPREGTCRDPLYETWSKLISTQTPKMKIGMEGALGEVFAHKICRDRGIRVLFYLWLESARVDEIGVRSIGVVSKQGRHEIQGHRWIDATDTGELISLLTPGTSPEPRTRSSYLFLRRESWGTGPILGEKLLLVPGAQVQEIDSGWANERAFCLREDLPQANTHRATWLRALPLLRTAMGTFSKGAVVSHVSFSPLINYAPFSPGLPLPNNCASACPGRCSPPPRSLAERFDLGLQASRLVQKVSLANTSNLPPAAWKRKADRPISTEVTVAGVGTAGALAALAAARQGAKVCAFDSLPFPGGVGTAGGIHLYYFGVPGGLQNEVDQRIRDIQIHYGSQDQIAGFHPVAKATILELMLAEAGVNTFFGSFLSRAETRGRKLQSVHFLGRESETHVRSDAWIDSTGDGDLCALAGASLRPVSRKDGLPLAYTQSSGRFRPKNGRLFHRIVNYDSGFVDSSSPEDLSRARTTGILQYDQSLFTEDERPTYLAPALGIREGRHVETIATLQLDDLLERRKFPDRIGLTGCHYDNHHTDFQFEDEGAVFWIWACRNWRERTASDIPYGMIVPRDLDNVWVACRAAGCTPDAHHSMRMQRDMQRLGEAAGVSAVLSIRRGCVNQEVPIRELQKILSQTGALQEVEPAEGAFGYTAIQGKESPVPASAKELLSKLDAGYGPAMYQIYRYGKDLLPDVLDRLNSADPSLVWRCACILSMWSDRRAVPRLLKSIETREYGFTPEDEAQGRSPEKSVRFAPNWLVALVLLRRCPDARAWPTLQALARDPELPLEARTSLLLTSAALAKHPDTLSLAQREIPELIDRLLASDPPGRQASPQRNFSGQVPTAMNSEKIWYPQVREDFMWQLHWSAACAEKAAGLSPRSSAQEFLKDERAPVRNAFHALLQPPANTQTI